MPTTRAPTFGPEPSAAAFSTTPAKSHPGRHPAGASVKALRLAEVEGDRVDADQCIVLRRRRRGKFLDNETTFDGGIDDDSADYVCVQGTTLQRRRLYRQRRESLMAIVARRWLNGE